MSGIDTLKILPIPSLLHQESISILSNILTIESGCELFEWKFFCIIKWTLYRRVLLVNILTFDLLIRGLYLIIISGTWTVFTIWI